VHLPVQELVQALPPHVAATKTLSATVCARYNLFYIVYSPVTVYENRMVPPLSVELVLACMYVS
jgi:hypothetical protein